MIVFGDVQCRERVSDKLRRVGDLLHAARTLNTHATGIGRHGVLVEALIEAGELAQGIADARFVAQGRRDTPSAQADAAMGLARWIAVQCVRSWDTRFDWVPTAASAHEALAAFQAVVQGEELLDVRQPEGYAFYALYPECHLAAARQVRRAIDGPWRVIGLRSIGTSLAAVVAAVLGDPAPRTLRPSGHPFDRRVSWSGGPPPDPGEHHAIVDEGPGLSGSSIAAAIRHLRQAGVPPSRIHVFPGHANGPGEQASAQIHSLWRQARTHVADFAPVLLHAPERVQRLRSWVEEIIGPLDAELEEIAAGGWRGLHRGSGERSNAEKAPAHPWQERRKFIVRSGAAEWLVKFAGLGGRARERCECARLLGETGFSPRVAGWCHGFVVERWHADMAPLTAAQWRHPPLRRQLLDRLARYIAFRARRFPADADSGASIHALCEMGWHNSRELLGSEADAMWQAHRASAAQLAPLVRRVRTDNRMHAWEWLHGGDLLLKTDAVDHHAGHDLVGCQDSAWDVAGAAVEFELDAAELGALAQAVAARGAVRIDERLLAFCIAAYLAFQAGHFRMAAGDARDEQERNRLEAQVERYMRELARRAHRG